MVSRGRDVESERARKNRLARLQIVPDGAYRWRPGDQVQIRVPYGICQGAIIRPSSIQVVVAVSENGIFFRPKDSPNAPPRYVRFRDKGVKISAVQRVL